jgi:hypothetical protein
MAAAQVEGYRQALNRIVDDPIANDPRVHHVTFKQLSADPVAAVRDFYSAAAMEFSTDFAGTMRAWLDDPANSSNRYGRYRYSLEPYGLDAAYVKEAFAPYRRRFGIA